jgi:hypothetical protein
MKALGKQDVTYLLRLWQADNGDQPVWRLSLEQVHEQQRVIFASLAELADFLASRMNRESDPDPAAPDRLD